MLRKNLSSTLRNANAALKFELDKLSGGSLQAKETIEKELHTRTLFGLKISSKEGSKIGIERKSIPKLIKATSLDENQKSVLSWQDKNLANDIHNCAKYVVELEDMGTINGEKQYYRTNDGKKHSFKHIVGYIQVPNIINRVKANQVLVENGMMNFIVRKHYKPIYANCTCMFNGIVGTPGIGKSVSLLYPLINHFTPYIRDESYQFQNVLLFCTMFLVTMVIFFLEALVGFYQV